MRVQLSQKDQQVKHILIILSMQDCLTESQAGFILYTPVKEIQIKTWFNIATYSGNFRYITVILLNDLQLPRSKNMHNLQKYLHLEKNLHHTVYQY